ncbi:MAG TPA: type VI secretion system baseplate subunit TssE [Chitinispirillaceae bacterium]|nr:type VI secretion system baseplate subunit TssE [Chitinispirillaceae bacterium]
MNQGLFESLTGEFLDNTPIDSTPVKNRRIKSIMDHLNRMFNTRKGSLPHLKDYGLPDISEIYRKMPHGIKELQEAIQRAVEIYEPRMENVQVMQKDSEDLKFKLIFIISGEMKNGGAVLFQTTFTSMGNSSITPWKKPE